jgi:pimeloyl-ACP methyl ester carboxylesterase
MSGGSIVARSLIIACLACALYSMPNHQHAAAHIVPPKIADAKPMESKPQPAPVGGTALVNGLDAFPLRGPALARGVIIWSHGRSLTREDSTSATPLYLTNFAEAGWDVMRFNRPRVIDRLTQSTDDLIARVHKLRAQGYAKIVLAGQSYGAFIALGAAQRNPDVDTVIATAPAAYGNFFDSYDSWQTNGRALDHLLRGVGQTRVALAFFHGDDYDPGGRGSEARAILTENHAPFLIIDQPRDLVGHLAANTGLFVRRYAACLVAFAQQSGANDATNCDDSWGLEPSVALLHEPKVDTVAQRDDQRTATGASTSEDEEDAMTGRWYGYYPNGREFLVDITARQGDRVEAVYGVGPSVDGGTQASWIERKGSVIKGSLVFDEPGRAQITLTPTELGTMDVLWRSVDGTGELESTARRIH